MWFNVNVSIFCISAIILFLAFYADNRWRFLFFALDHNEYPMPLFVIGVILLVIAALSSITLLIAKNGF